MRERIVFFILGAVLATIAYFVGNANNVDADIKTGRYNLLVVDELVVKSKILVNESGLIDIADNSTIGLMIKDNEPAIVVSHRENGIDQSGIMISTPSLLDEPSRPTIFLIANTLKEQYTIRSNGVIH